MDEHDISIEQDAGMDVDPPDLATLTIGPGPEQPATSNSSDQSYDLPSVRVQENDRQYADTNYFLPDDAEEATRISVEHQAFTLFLERRLTMTHLPSRPLRILDIGTGPGDWALAAAIQNPQATVIASDFSSEIGSAAGEGAPSNLEFQLDDIRRTPWEFEPQSFDFIHMRGLGGAFTESELMRIYAEAHRCLTIGGQLEISDFGSISIGGNSEVAASSDDSLAAAALALSTYNSSVQEACDRRGVVGLLDLAHSRPSLIEQSGLRVQRTLQPVVPLGQWSDRHRDHRIGRMAAVAMLEGLEARALRLLTRDLAWSRDAVAELVQAVMQGIQAPGTRATVVARFVIARKGPT